MDMNIGHVPSPRGIDAEKQVRCEGIAFSPGRGGWFESASIHRLQCDAVCCSVMQCVAV